MTDTTEAQINALERLRETEEADVDFLLAQLGINMDSIAARTAVRSFRKKNIQLGVIHAAAANASQPPVDPVETKTVYVKRWRTLVNLPAKYADGIVEALRPHAKPPAAPVETCANCNGTKKAIYFSEQAMCHEERDCHVCRPRSPAAAPVDISTLTPNATTIAALQEPFMMLSCREAKRCLHNIPGCICDGDPTNG